VIRPESADDPAFAERFHREARTLARMNHPNIVGVHDFGEVECEGATLYYFVMEFVDGMNLRQWMQAGRVSVEQAATILAQVCDALQYAHDEGVVHRDIKPENLLLDRRGRVKIADFGLARLVVGSAEDFALTGTHQVMGTPRYMAPEQLAGSRDVDHRADIYALGVVFYEMLTGSLPLGSFDLPSARVDCDGRLDQIVLTALASDPDRRFHEVRQLGEQLQTVVPAAVTSISVFADANALPGQPWPGPSTILENAVGAAWGQVQDGRVLRLFTHRNAPAIAAIVLALVQLTVAVFALAEADKVRRSLAIDVASVLQAVEPFMLTTGAAGFVLVLVLFGFGSARRLDRFRPVAILATGIICAVTLLRAWPVMTHVGSQPDQVVAVAGRTTAQFWFGSAVCATLGMLIAGAWDLRGWLRRTEHQRNLASFAPRRTPVRYDLPADDYPDIAVAAQVSIPVGSLDAERTPAPKPEPPGSLDSAALSVDEELQDIAAQSEIDGPAVALLLAGITVAVGHFIAVVAILDSWTNSRWFRPDEFYVGWLSISILQGAVMAFGGLQFYRRRSLTWSRIGAITACLPMGPAVLLSAIAGIYAHRTLGRESVRQAFFRETRRLRRQRQTEPRLSGKAAFGTIWALSCLLFQLLLTVSLFALRKNQTGAFASPFSDITVIQLIPLGLVGLSPALSTVFGVLAIRDIKRSRGMLKGFGMAFFSVVCFPLLLFNAIILSRLMPAVDYLLSDLSPPLTRAISTILGLGMILLNILLLWYVWRKLKPQAGLTAVVPGIADSDR
jgi:hypothetical protein